MRFGTYSDLIEIETEKCFNYIVNFTYMISRWFRPISFFYPKLDFNLLDNSLFIEFHVTLHANLLYFILDVDKSYDYFTQKAVNFKCIYLHQYQVLIISSFSYGNL